MLGIDSYRLSQFILSNSKQFFFIFVKFIGCYYLFLLYKTFTEKISHLFSKSNDILWFWVLTGTDNVYGGKSEKSRNDFETFEHCPVNWQILVNKILCEKLIET